MQRFLIGALTVLLVGCTTSGVIENRALKQFDSNAESAYSIKELIQRGSQDTSVMLAFSGGGTRAAALSYGILTALKDTPVTADGKPVRLLDEVTNISAVSGGSFTAAYYGIHGDKTFDQFEEVFLRRNIQGGLQKTLLNPKNWFDERGYTELAVDLYQQQVFKGATFADMLRPNAPLIMINASDLNHGVRFSFVQEYFDLLCSDLRTFPVARAVAASSAVPIIFNPIVVKNHTGCQTTVVPWLKGAMTRSNTPSELALAVNGLRSYNDKEARKFVHFVDGGITDNLGLRAIYDFIELSGGIKETAAFLEIKPVERFVVISVDAAVISQNTIDQTNQHPSLVDTANAISDVQLQRYNVATIDIMKQSIQRWTKELSTPQKQVEPYFIQLNFNNVKDDAIRTQLNAIPTNFNLTDEQVDLLIQQGRKLLFDNPEFKRLLKDIRLTNTSGG